MYAVCFKLFVNSLENVQLMKVENKNIEKIMSFYFFNNIQFGLWVFYEK